MNSPSRNHAPRIRPASDWTEQEPNPEEEGQPLPPAEIDGEEEAEPELQTSS